MRSRLPWILAAVSSALLCLPAEAAQLSRWQLNAPSNQLEFSTNGRVKPQAQMIMNPMRVVVDLPGVKLGRSKIMQPGQGAIREVRIAQFNRQTTRIVVELASGWTLDPQQVRVRERTANNWVLEMPEPQRVSIENELPTTTPPYVPPTPPVTTPPVSTPPVSTPPVSRPPVLTPPAPVASQPIKVTLPPGPPPVLETPTPSNPSVPNGRYLVVIDPGHGGPDPGAVGQQGLRETDVVLDIARQVSSQLEAAGIKTLMTRSGEYDLDLAPRVAMAERANATIFVSIHANAISLSRPDVNGLETYYYSSGGDLARTIHQKILQTTNIRDRGVRTARFYVLTQTSMPSVLVETGFVTGAQDSANLRSSQFRTQMAKGIAEGVKQYLGL